MSPKLQAAPCFDATSPFFLKLSVAVINVASMMLLLQAAAEPQLETPPSSSSAASLPAQLTVSRLTGHFYTVLLDKHHGIFSSPSSARPRWRTPSPSLPGADTCQNTTSAAWQHAAGRQTGLSAVHQTMGGLLFATLPMLFSVFAVVACLSPIITIIAPPKSTHRSTMCTVMVQAIVYGVFCLHSSLLVARYILADGSSSDHSTTKGSIGTRVLVSTLSLHSATHMLYQTCACHSRLLLARGVRRCTRANSSLVQPVMVGCLCAVHLLAALSPAASLDIVGSVKDMVIAHAVVAFIPEILGSVFMACSGSVYALMNTAGRAL